MLTFILLTLDFVPSVIALLRRKSSTVAIIALNLLLGWTLLGWVGAFVWSLMAENRFRRS